jgi:hypothetical protein
MGTVWGPKIQNFYIKIVQDVIQKYINSKKAIQKYLRTKINVELYLLYVSYCATNKFSYYIIAHSVFRIATWNTYSLFMIGSYCIIKRGT